MFESKGISFLRNFQNLPGFDYLGTFKEAMVECLRDFRFTHNELNLISEAAQQLIHESDISTNPHSQGN